MDFLTQFDLSQVQPEHVSGVMTAAVAAGLLYCFLGWRLVHFVIGLTGFLLAGAFAGLLAGWVAEGRLLPMAIAGVLGGLCGATAFFFLYRLGVFVLGTLAGALLCYHILEGRTEPWVTSAIVGAAVFGGLSGLLLERVIVAAATATLGAWLMAQGGAFLLLQRSATLTETAENRVFLAAWAGLGLAGAAVQLRGPARGKDG